MEKGKYIGFYQFDNKKAGILRGFDRTNFTIEITDIDGLNFRGWVEDDIASGGMEGRGTISGKIDGNKISFVKRMPYLGTLVKDRATGSYQGKIDKNRKHRPIYYSGSKVENTTYQGKWNFRFYGIVVCIAIWIRKIKTGGTWQMSKVNE